MGAPTPPGHVRADAPMPIVMFGLARGMFDHGALGIARSAGRLRIPVYRVSQERWAPARLSRYSSGWLPIPKDSSDEQVLGLLHKLSGEIGRGILVPIDDAGSVFADTHAAVLAEDFLFPRQPAGLARELASKRTMYELCQKHDIPAPASFFPQSETDLTQLARQLTFPAVIKVIEAADAGPHVPRVMIAQDPADLFRAYRVMESPKSSNIMLQEYIPGNPESVWMFNGYFDAHSECKVAFTGKKIRQSPPYTGVTTLGVCEPNPAVQEATTRLMKAVGYRGIVDIGFRFDQRDGQYKLLDVNPRIGGSFRLFVGQDGTDVLRALYRDLMGKPVATTAPTEGRRWIVEPLDLKSAVVYRRRGDITLMEWIRSLRGIREAAWFAADDPLPFLALWLAVLLWLPRLGEVRR